MRIRGPTALVSVTLLASTRADFFQRNAGPGGFFGSTGFYRPRGAVNNEEYYTILGLQKSASLAEVKKAYRRLVVKMHPDKGGDETKFKKLQTAYEVLSDPEKRRLYDAYGTAGVEMGNGAPGAGMGYDDLLSQLLRRNNGPKRAPNLFLAVQVTLEELYTGTTRKIKLNRQKVVDHRVVLEPKTLEATIEKGARDRSRIVLPGESEGLGSQVVAGDIIVEVREVKHPVFTRRNADLLLDAKITLTEALVGFQRPIRHLDGRQIWLKSRPGTITKPGSLWMLEEEGMPIFGNTSERGRLFIRFEVEFPTSLGSLKVEEIEKLRKILPKAPVFTREIGTHEEDVELKVADGRTFGSIGSRSEEEGAEEDDAEEEGFGPGNVQCSQQ